MAAHIIAGSTILKKFAEIWYISKLRIIVISIANRYLCMNRRLCSLWCRRCSRNKIFKRIGNEIYFKSDFIGKPPYDVPSCKVNVCGANTTAMLAVHDRNISAYKYFVNIQVRGVIFVFECEKVGIFSHLVTHTIKEATTGKVKQILFTKLTK